MRTLVIVLILGATPPAVACGPDFPNQLLGAPDRAVLTAPAGNFSLELAPLLKTGGAKLLIGPAGDSDEVTKTADLADIGKALANLPADARNRMIAAAGALRVHLLASKTAAPVPAGLPAEFRLYLEGAIAWRTGQPAVAIAAWQKVLKLPAKQRAFRTTRLARGDRGRSVR